MWSKFNYDNLPIVNVEFDGIIENNNDFVFFINEWEKLYNKKEDFEFVFDTSGCGIINPKYSLYMAFYIKKLKKKPIQYLKKSTIYVYHKTILHLLNLVFYFEKPVAPVHLIFKNNNIEEKKIINP
tara:strand:+ start:132 stop:509 length:378 start_codon:yes stop_codon:yes gene_type:complete